MGPSAARAQQAAKVPTIGFSGPALWAPSFRAAVARTRLGRGADRCD
jgi:hypothetical protein